MLYRNMTSRDLARHAVEWRGANPQTERLLYAMAKRLEQEARRASEANSRYAVAREFYERQPRLGKPHIKLIHWPWYEARGMGSWQWVCLGPQGTRAYGSSPAKAYQAWARAMGRSVTAYRRKV